MQVFWIFLKLGLTSFGGPAAHLAFFRDEFVVRRAWLSDREYSELVALCQFLPGPASSQVGFALGLQRQGWSGALQAFAGFTLPTAVAMGVLGALALTTPPDSGLLAGILAVTVAVVAQAVWGMYQQFCQDTEKRMICLGVAALLLVVNWAFLPIILIGGLLAQGAWGQPMPRLSIDPVRRRVFILFCVLFLLGLVAGESGLLIYLSDFFLPGALVFGGGHVALPLLQGQVEGQMTDQVFLAGYGAAQAMPGPLFAFSSFLGAAGAYPLGAFMSAVLATLAIFAPGFMLLVVLLPLWETLKALPWASNALMRVNAVVVGLLLAAFFSPVLEHGVQGPVTALMAFACWVALYRYKVSPWKLVLSGAVLGWLLLGS